MSAVAQRVQAPAVREIRPQEGPQEMFLSSDADIAIYGGSAFAGKTYALLMDDLPHVHDSHYASVTFRRATPQITNPGALWDESCRLYAAFGARPLSNALEQLFPSGAVAKYAHLEHALDVRSWDGSQIPVLKFDQLESFEASQFWYMLSRNRDPSGHLKPYCRATCNPDPDCWLASFLSWWIDQNEFLEDGQLNPKHGYAIWERSGVLRWFIRVNEEILWANSPQELLLEHGVEGLSTDDPEQVRPLSVTFIPGRIWDNKIGMRNDPGYLAKLKAMSRVERARLLGDSELGGNWKVRASAGLLFQRQWCNAVSVVPSNLEAVVRGWDLAATEEKKPGRDRKMSMTVGVKIARYRRRAPDEASRFLLLDARRITKGPAAVEQAFINTAAADGRGVRISVPQDPGQAGKAQASRFVGLLPGFDVRTSPESGDKVTRFNPFSAQVEAGNVDYLDTIDPAYLASLEGFPDGPKDDGDATSRAFDELTRFSGPVDMFRGVMVGGGDVSVMDGIDTPFGTRQ